MGGLSFTPTVGIGFGGGWFFVMGDRTGSGSETGLLQDQAITESETRSHGSG